MWFTIRPRSADCKRSNAVGSDLLSEGARHALRLDGDLAQRPGRRVLETDEVEARDAGLLAKAMRPAARIGDGVEAFDERAKARRVAGGEDDRVEGMLRAVCETHG